MIPSVKSPRHPHTLSRVALAVLIIATVVAAALLSSQSASSQGDDRQRRDLDRVFSRHERLSLDAGQVARQVKQTRSLTLNTSRGTFEMTLEPHDMRAPGYRAEAWGDKGVTVLEPMPVRTYKGTVKGLPAAQARMTIDEETVEGLIITPNELLFLEPSKRFSGSAAKTDFVFYAASDVKESSGECGLTMSQVVEQHSTSAANQTSKTGPKPEALFGPTLKIGIALEADFEYFSGPGGGSEADTVKLINTIMSEVEGLMYNPQIGLQFQLLHTRVWTTANDPYTSSDPAVLLQQFTNTYNTSAPEQAAGRDLAHLWTGKNLDGTTIGIAWLPGLACSSQGDGYGLSQNIDTNRPVLTAHEIGHNMGAVHVNSGHGGDCPESVMKPSISSSTNFCDFSRGQITTHAIANQNCLTESQACSYTISPQSLHFTTAGGNGSVTVTPSGGGCSWAAAEGELWLSVTSGGSGTGNGTVNYSLPANNVCGTRTAQMNIGGQIHTVQQTGNPNYLIDPGTATGISPGQPLNGNITIADCPYGTGDRVRAFMDRYKFNGMAGQQIRIEMNAAIPAQSGGLDTYLYLLAPDGSIVNQNDDIHLGIQTNSRIPCANVPSGPCATEFYTLTQTGTYIIVATSFSEGEAGQYTLTLTSVPLLLTTQVTDSVGTAAALNSVTFARTSNATHTAFRIVDTHNFSADQITRLILFSSDLGLVQQQNPASSLISVSAGGHPLVVENVGPFTFPGLNGTYIVVALKRSDGGAMPTGSLAFTVSTANGTLTSNVTTLTIAP